MIDASAKRAVAAFFERLAAKTGDASWQRAALELRPRRGRHSIDDAPALSEMAWLLENSRARSVEDAASVVAATLTGEHSAEAARERLARKFRRNKISNK